MNTPQLKKTRGGNAPKPQISVLGKNLEAIRKHNEKAEREARNLALYQADLAQKKQAAEEEARLQQKAKEASFVARQEKIRKILARPAVKGTFESFTYQGIFIGIPIVGDEWKSLPNEKYCVEVTSYDDSTNKYGNLTGKCFVVNKRPGGGEPSKKLESNFEIGTISSSRPSIKKLGTIVVEINGHEPLEVCIYTKESLNLLLSDGKKGGGLAAIYVNDNSIQLYRFSKGIFAKYGDTLPKP